MELWSNKNLRQLKMKIAVHETKLLIQSRKNKYDTKNLQAEAILIKSLEVCERKRNIS